VVTVAAAWEDEVPAKIAVNQAGTVVVGAGAAASWVESR
jgi:hypothetical protein